ncbi:MAG: RDD family protein [Chitinophagaceae bacterium]|nr:RDD family protein [Chitinophagaceae bacterium]
MPIIKLDTGFNIEVEFPVAIFGKRLVAWTIDVLICWLITKALALMVNTDSFFVWTSVWEVKGVLISLPVLFYHLFFEIILNGRSPGKLAMNLRVITEEGGQPGIGQYLIRWVFRWVDLPYWVAIAAAIGALPWWTFPLVFSGVAAVLFTPKSQRLGDIVAGTILIDTRNRTSWQDTVFTEVSDDYKPKYPGVMQLTDRDINTLKNIIETVKKKNDHELARKIAEKILSKTEIQTDEYPIDFLERLLTDYNYYSTK